MYFIGAEEGPENEIEITSETSAANTNGTLAAVEYARVGVKYSRTCT